MPHNTQPLFTRSFLAGIWGAEFESYRTAHDEDIHTRLTAWSSRRKAKETSDEAPLISNLFSSLLGYLTSGSTEAESFYHLWQQFPIEGAGAGGGTGQADLAIGYFRKAKSAVDIPQVLCEFKDIRSGLDAPQKRKANSRSPVSQCFDYLRYSFDLLEGGEAVEPTWAIVTDMNEFRLYNRSRGPAFSQRFILEPSLEDQGEVSLLDTSDEGAFERFLFVQMLSPEMLLAEVGRSALSRLLQDQWIAERAIEKEFYLEYKEYRSTLFAEIQRCNPDFSGTPGRLVRLTQRLLDRLIFILFCEDMGAALDFPHDLLRKMMVEFSRNTNYRPDSWAFWSEVQDLFRVMDNGGQFGEHTINCFNGGLFDLEPELENLKLPTSVFYAQNQGGGGRELLEASKSTLLYFSASYNFGVARRGDAPVIDLYMLGRIFEQSITELEIMEAEAEGRPSINLLSKRKRDGVYYTPEQITEYIVRETVGGRLQTIREECGLDLDDEITEEEISQYHLFLKDRRKTAPRGAAYLKSLRTYSQRLEQITVLDPACGSGAFLVQTMRFLLQERRSVASRIAELTGQEELWDQESVFRSVLSTNIFGVDINPESVEITRLALWLNTALPGKKLTSLDKNIRCGNSLVGPEFAEFYRAKHSSLFEEVDEVRREKINAFDWREAFPEIFEKGGFDCVVGNPPYVKLQNFRRVEKDVAEYLVDAQAEDASPIYGSTQTGNFDLYLPFFEAGINLLNPDGYMGYIAPNLWLKNKYGEGLRQFVRSTRTLDRWVDFGSHQVFEDATTYTALQFFRKRPTEGVRFASSPEGELAGLSWEGRMPLDWDDLPEDPKESWILVSPEERAVMEKMEKAGDALGALSGTGGIIVGIQTSADSVYHLQKIGPGRYVRCPGKAHESEHLLEDELMKPLVSGPEAKRYRTPRTDTYLLFPYDVSGEKPHLISAHKLETEYPKAWQYLREFESELRGRESGKFNDESWYRFGRNQNIDKQKQLKLGVAQTVPSLRVFFDSEGLFALNNVRVNGILPKSTTLGWFLTGVLNTMPANFYFTRGATPKDGGYFEANKQFIAPIPIPKANEKEVEEVADRARSLQEWTTEIYDLEQRIAKLLESPQCSDRELNESWFWSDVRASWKEWKADAPKELKGKERSNWARDRRGSEIAQRLEPLTARLRRGTGLTARFEDGELLLLADGVSVISGLYVVPQEGGFIYAQWSHTLRGTNVTDQTGAKAIFNALRELRATENPAIRDAVVDLNRQIEQIALRIAGVESEMEAIVSGLYGLAKADLKVIENAR